MRVANYVPITVTYEAAKDENDGIIICKLLDEPKDTASMIELEADVETGKILEVCTVMLNKIEFVENFEANVPYKSGTVYLDFRKELEQEDLREVFVHLKKIYNYKALIDKAKRKVYLIWEKDFNTGIEISEHLDVLTINGETVVGFVVKNFSDREWKKFIEEIEWEIKEREQSRKPKWKFW